MMTLLKGVCKKTECDLYVSGWILEEKVAYAKISREMYSWGTQKKKGAPFEIFDTLLTAPRTVSNTAAQVAGRSCVQITCSISSTRHVQRRMPPGTKGQLSC